jgi:hypothetical protein
VRREEGRRLSDLQQIVAGVERLDPAHLPAVLAAVAARMAATVTRPEPAVITGEPDALLGVEEVGALIHRSPSWVRKHGRRLPGVHQPDGPGSRIRWSRRALEAWLNDCSQAASRRPKAVQ